MRRLFYAGARQMKRLITGLESTSAEHTGKKVLPTGVNNGLFSFGFWDDPFRLIHVYEIYLTPGSEKTIAPHPEWGGISRFVISLEDAAHALEKDQGRGVQGGFARYRERDAAVQSRQFICLLRASGA